MVSRPADAMISSGVDDQGDTPVSQDRGSGNAGDHAVVFLEALDDDLALVVDHIDGERRAASGLAFHEKENIAIAWLPAERHRMPRRDR
jgi:hypothetical protein